MSALCQKQSIWNHRKGESDVKLRAAPSLVLRPYLPIVSFNDRARNGQAHPHSVRLCREKWLNNILEVVQENAGACIRYRDFGRSLVTGSSDHDPALAFCHFDIASMAFTTRLRMTCWS